jgi:hypothetical protein
MSLLSPFKPEPDFAHGTAPTNKGGSTTAILLLQPARLGRQPRPGAAPLSGRVFSDARVVEI